MTGPFKMKGFSGFGNSPYPKTTDPKTTDTKSKKVIHHPDEMDQGLKVEKGEEADFYKGQQTQYDYSQMKQASKRDGNTLERLTKRYGGEWAKKTDRYGRVTFRNQDNRTVQDVESTFLTPPE